jgi:hypothetical protein
VSHMLIQMMAAMGGGIPYREFVTLSGTQGAPLTKSHLAIIPDEAIVQWAQVNAASIPNNLVPGKFQSAKYDEGDAAVYVTAHSWVTPNEGYTGSYWIRATNEGDGVSNTELDPNSVGSSALDTWLDATSFNKFWGWKHDGPVVMGGTIKVELSTDASGTPVVATGYYRGLVSAES